jgi:Caspase domain/Glucodextranase, domain B
MKRNVLIFSLFFLTAQVLLSQAKSVPFFDGFDNNKNNWVESQNSERYIKVEEGAYVFNHKRNKEGWEVHSSVDINTSKDFKIETLIVKKSGEQGYGYGLLWGKDDIGNFYAFNITGSGYFRISKSDKGKFVDLVAWKKSDAIKTGNGPYNILKIEKRGNNVHYFINGTEVATLDFESFFGNQIGFLVYNKQAININYLSVYYLKNTNPKPVVYNNGGNIESIPFFDGFNTNKYNWSLKNTSSTIIDITSGELNINHKTATGYDEVHKKFNLNGDKNFVINTSFYKKSGVEGYGYGIYWGASDMDNRYTFLLSANGQYSIYKKVDGKITYLQSWTSSSAIKKGLSQTNIISIKRLGNNYEFYINDKFAKSTPFISFSGNKIGYLVFNKQQIDVHYLSMYYPKTTEPKVVVSHDDDDNFKHDAIFTELFNSNANDWATNNNDNVLLNIRNGAYNFNHKRNKLGWTTTKEIKIDESKDYEIETVIRKVSGIQNNGYGLIWGRKDGDNEFEFFISGDGSYYIKYYEDNKATKIKSWTPSSSINTGNGAVNKLKVRKEGNKYKFYINDKFVAESYAKAFFGDRIGFLIYGNQAIAVESLNINYIYKKVIASDYLFYDEFTNNINNWAVASDKDYNLKISSGKYYFEHKRTTGGWSSSIEKYIDETKDYEIETKILKISGIKNNGFGIMWGRKGSGNTLEFDIASNGLYSVDRSVNSKRNKLIKWTSSAYIKQGNYSYNTLKIRKQEGVIKFYINGNYVNQITNKTFLGNRIGFIIYDNQKIAIDYLKIRYLDKVVVSPNILTTTLSGPMDENFSNNNNAWATGSQDEYNLNLSNGYYNFEHKRSSGGWSTTVANKIDETKNFEITTEIKKISGVDNYGFGLVFGRKDTKNQFNFFISSDGNFKIKKIERDNTSLIQDWKKSSYINKGNGATNILSIRKNNNTLNFYINNNFVASKEFMPFLGNRIGFIIYSKQKIAINYLKIKYLKTDVNNSPPTIVITEPAVTRGFKIVKAKRITVKGKATDSDGVYEVTVNGVDAALQADGTFIAQVPLRVGNNNLNVKATDLKYNSSLTKFIIKREVKPIVIVDPNIDNNNIKKKIIKTDGGTYYALLIGVSDYDDSKIVSLDGMPTNDIQNLADALIGYYTFDENNVEALSNPTRSKIIRAFDRLKKKVTPKDNLLIFYAGHGTYVEEDKIGYWLPADAEADYTDNWINNTLVRDNIKRIKSKHTLLISDACFSGSIFKTRAFSIKNANLSIQKKYELPSRKAITSGTLKTVPNISVFMKYLLDRLENNKDAYVSAGQMFNRIETPVGNNSPNIPQYGTIQGVGDEGGDFIFIRKN